jgi:hypothetical protein
VITSAGANVLLQRVHPGFHSVPIHHHIYLKSNVVSGQVVVGAYENNIASRYPDEENDQKYITGIDSTYELMH